MFKRFALFLIIAVAFSWITLVYIQGVVREPLLEQGEKLVTVPSGTSLIETVNDLHSEGVFKANPKIYTLYARYLGQEQIKAGEYQIEAGQNFLEFLGKMHRGETVLHEIRFIEGWSFAEFSRVLRDSGLFRKVVDNWSPDAIIALLSLKETSPEGLFYPDTYHFPSTASDLDILRYTYTVMQQVLEEEWNNRAEGLPYKNAYEALIMASIVEKETGAPEERAEIAGVFVRRLQQGMRLQTDPTVIYGLGDTYKGNLTRKHLRQATPFNTYVIKGLPPTPIASPGREAIHAALHPAEGETLFFVAKGDGRHHFSVTLEEHNKAVRKYQVNNRRSDYKSSVK